MAKKASINRMWKQFESTVARDFGSERNPLSGENSRHDTNSDALHEKVYIEAKRDQKVFGIRLVKLIEDTMAKAKKEKKVPMIAVKIKGKHGYMVVCHKKDLKALAEEMV